jgi:hypothetical protein
MVSVYGDKWLALFPNLKLKDQLMSAFRDYLFNSSATTIQTGDRSLIFNLRTHHAVTTGNHLS